MLSPIILFPGIMGTRLYFSASDLYWDPDSSMRMLGWMPTWPFRTDDDNRRALHASQPATPIVETSWFNSPINPDKRDRGWSTVVWSFYGNMLNAIDEKYGSGSAWAAGYDWRQDIPALADYAEAKIDAALAQSRAQQVSIITHSMGGLVVRAALRRSAAKGNPLAAKIKTLIHVCMPAAGAVVLYRRLFTGMIPTYDGGSGLSDRLFRFLLGDSAKAFVGNFSGMPGAAELLPTDFLQPPNWNSQINGQPINTIYAGLCPPGLVPINAGLAPDVVVNMSQRVADINAYQTLMADPHQMLHPNTWHIYGNAHPTETSIAFANGAAQPVVTNGVGAGAGGDGTVPILSALSLGVSSPGNQIAVSTEHSTACKNPQVMAQVLQALP